jgi:hypothetical protein
MAPSDHEYNKKKTDIINARKKWHRTTQTEEGKERKRKLQEPRGQKKKKHGRDVRARKTEETTDSHQTLHHSRGRMNEGVVYVDSPFRVPS